MTTTDVTHRDHEAPGALRTALESARQSVLLLRYRRFFWFLPVLLGLMFVFAYVIGGRAHDSVDGAHLYCVITWWGLGTVVVPWMTLYLGVQAVHGELEDRTSQYLFLRPVRREQAEEVERDPPLGAEQRQHLLPRQRPQPREARDPRALQRAIVQRLAQDSSSGQGGSARTAPPTALRNTSSSVRRLRVMLRTLPPARRTVPKTACVSAPSGSQTE